MCIRLTILQAAWLASRFASDGNLAGTRRFAAA